MPRSYFDSEVPIVALATPAGESALAAIRAFGPGSIELAASRFSRPGDLLASPGMRLVHGELVDPAAGEAIDEVLAAVYRAPGGPVGEDGVEFFCHGSPAVIRRALAALEQAGFSPALPGEFSFRAFLRGKTDLVRAEAVQELVRASSEGARAEAVLRLEGGLSRRVAALRSGLVDLLAEAEARLDFDEEDGAPSEGIPLDLLASLGRDIEALAASYAVGRLYDAGALVVIAGRPNAGKSSLFNLLLKEERAIVSSESGTTRDWIEAGIELDGLPLRLVDTAGLRGGPGGPTGSPAGGPAIGGAEAEGVARSRRLAAEADAVVYVVDGVAGVDGEDERFLESRPDAVRVWNKVDDPRCRPAPEGFLSASATEGSGLADLAGALRGALAPDFALARDPGGEGGGTGGAGDGEARALPPRRREAVVASGRQKRLLDSAAAALAEARSGAMRGEALDALALRLREASDALGEIIGEVASEEVLDSIFSRFCLGK
jgi:tRNA modification GTPase